MPHVNMGRLSVLASHRVNGVSELHSELVQGEPVSRISRVCFPAGSRASPTASRHRRWLMPANPELSALLDEDHRVGLAAAISTGSAFSSASPTTQPSERSCRRVEARAQGGSSRT